METHKLVRVFPEGESWMVSYLGGYVQYGYGNRADAEHAAKTIAQSRRPSTVRLVNGDGETEYELTY